MKTMKTEEFKLLVDAILEELQRVANSHPEEIRSCKDGTAFEKVVYNAAEKIKDNWKPAFCITYDAGSHRFPDLIFDFGAKGKFGIEVKSTSSPFVKHWKINGNSILGSTKDTEVIDTYIIFGKTQQLEFKAGKYSDCISDIAVTHSPRYMIDMDLSKEDTFFKKSRIDYEKLINSNDPINIITSYYRKQGKQAWWISDETPPTITFWGELTDEEKDYCISYGFVHFPELFSNKQSKYKRFAAWLVAAKGTITTSLRDFFSASGRVTFMVNETSYNDLPHIYKTLREHASTVKRILEESDAEVLHDDWQAVISSPDEDWEAIISSPTSKEDLIRQWAYCVKENINSGSYLYDGISIECILNLLHADKA